MERLTSLKGILTRTGGKSRQWVTKSKGRESVGDLTQHSHPLNDSKDPVFQNQVGWVDRKSVV